MSSFADKLTTIQQDDDIDIDIDVDLPAVSVPPPHLQNVDPEPELTQTAEPALQEHSPEEIRGTAINLRGVDDLSTREVKLFIDHYIKPGYSFATKDQFARFDCRLEWINDTSLNAVFETEEAATEALSLLLQAQDLDLSNAENVERECKPFVRAAVGGSAPTEDPDVKLFARKATFADAKVKGAKQYSRYYLLHGEPEADQRIGKTKKNYYENYLNKKNGNSNSNSDTSSTDNYRSREARRSNSRWAGVEDLITGEKDTADERGNEKITLGDDDLFAGRTVTKLSRPLSQRLGEGRWQNDRYPGNGDDHGRDRDRRRNGRGNRGPRPPHRSEADEDDLFPSFRTRELSPGRD
ncbi:unnamed protein product [Kuraishia capsulata CBS 1993]|uniref:Uncharacterized protein n=1 Tax=Kuraishia capsulata CBS 1993 TaxID=1382522 RepID=W6MJA9_9ASCO|nr:uncharacterized protein KUCA_T00002323001 [Kuraishia capsulata CBS 1993]CDK26351.1 unnamed protein product [Kuraishia capsulata CBS 1993]